MITPELWEALQNPWVQLGLFCCLCGSIFVVLCARAPICDENGQPIGKSPRDDEPWVEWTDDMRGDADPRRRRYDA